MSGRLLDNSLDVWQAGTAHQVVPTGVLGDRSRAGCGLAAGPVCSADLVSVQSRLRLAQPTEAPGLGMEQGDSSQCS